MEIMTITLTREAPQSLWGKADVSFQGHQALIHLSAADELRQVQMAARKIRSQGISKVQLDGELWSLDSQWAFSQGFTTAKGPFEVLWCGDVSTQATLSHRFEAASFARKLVNETPEELSPVILAEHAANWLKDIGGDKVSFDIFEGQELLEKQWIGLHAVGRGSERPPAMLVLDFNPLAADAKVSTALVGKGITFDSGGYSIKPSEGMLDMKCDMGGAATVTAALGLAMKAGLNKRVKLFLCCAENLISGHAYKLGDILTYKNGVTVEVVNTDAEGRLVLADGLQAASDTGAELIIDAATLTGAAIMAVGNNYNAIFSPQMETLQLAQQKAATVAENVWPLPLDTWHKDMCPSPYADTANSRAMKGGGAGGASNAAGFLWRFVSPEVNWLHMDLAGAYASSATPLWSAGATAHGVLTIAAMLER
ncbi:aminopeptidase PepB [Pseudomonadota bacterium]|uniref:aminopeptidase PepB n=1 Tax=unclassified Shewanella TaxID=196818 RepID=UPI000C843389|nr:MULTISPECIES: aminopeptidase PepB [unclassified Shewanella]MDO6618025.1 aminopeptidase PepB [Shewanella sp. 6_MG-2023]MDO6640990.1 aminopeptidase PepB [Shewanella sp. 5_MG-2023]MDO6679184.1 aminopeptidase PepB [Shewanella sp. 4_MG-2023]MDO6776485.1 aminopeptidase PepB [Shewanella sp. 3_MG-2023]PMH89232.1 aminopeptidase PepB [Shewanella sp. 10N.286.48.B5]